MSWRDLARKGGKSSETTENVTLFLQAQMDKFIAGDASARRVSFGGLKAIRGIGSNQGQIGFVEKLPTLLQALVCDRKGNNSDKALAAWGDALEAEVGEETCVAIVTSQVLAGAPAKEAYDAFMAEQSNQA